MGKGKKKLKKKELENVSGGAGIGLTKADLADLTYAADHGIKVNIIRSNADPGANASFRIEAAPLGYGARLASLPAELDRRPDHVPPRIVLPDD